MPTFEFLRLSLSVPTAGPLEGGALEAPPETRSEFLTEVFGSQRKFFHKEKMYIYVPAPDDSLEPGVMAGFIGRQRTVLEPDGPEHLFMLTPKDIWRASFLAVDLRDGRQVVAIEKRQDVGVSNTLIEHLIEHVVRQRKKYSWHTDVEFITREEEFWSVASRMKGRISELSFTFYPPNGLRGMKWFKEVDKIAKQETNSEYSGIA